MNSLPPSIYVATSKDSGFIIAANLAMALETENRELDRATVEAGVHRVLSDAALGRYYIAWRNGERVGQMLITHEFSDWRNGLFWWIQSVYVMPDHRKSGVYAALHAYVESLARQSDDVCGLRLYVEVDNGAARQVYERLGMVETGYRLYEQSW